MEGNEMNKLMGRNNAPFRLSSVEMSVNCNTGVNIYPEKQKGESEQKNHWLAPLSYK